ncbi:hypothetical protein GLYMA_12G213850v4 [Glycine max]|nr:hypothetical protein GLYMA_12G213850v4 [Glycine max]
MAFMPLSGHITMALLITRGLLLRSNLVPLFLTDPKLLYSN